MTINLCSDCKYAAERLRQCTMRHHLTGFSKWTDLLGERNSLSPNDCGPEAKFFIRKIETTVL